MKRDETDNSIYFSALHGGMIYRHRRLDRDPLPDADWPPRKPPRPETTRCPILSPLRGGGTREEVFLRRIGVRDEAHFRRIERRVSRPPRTDEVLWPVDLVLLSETQSRECHSAVARVYADRIPRSAYWESERFALAFRNPHGFHAVSIAEAKRAEKKKEGAFAQFDWRSRDARDFAAGLLAILQELNCDGYFYNDFHLSRVFLTAERKLMLDYSELILSAEDDSFPLLDAERRDYPPEFADPAVMRGVIPAPDFQSQNYSLCAFLFFLFFGLFPYDGNFTRHLRDDDAESHYKKFLLHYHKEIPPVFVFDPEDSRNSLGAFGEDEAYMKLWAEAPEALRRRFADALSEENVMRRSGGAPRFPNPADWLDVLREIGWIS